MFWMRGIAGRRCGCWRGFWRRSRFFRRLPGMRRCGRGPMGRVVAPLRRMGATALGRQGGELAPLAIRGGDLRGIEYDLPVASAQVKSCILLAGLSASGDTVLHQPALSRDHTERMVTAMGASVALDGLDLRLRPGPLTAIDVAVPGDISSAAFWMVAGLCHSEARALVRGVGLNPSRTGVVDALRAMGAGDDSLRLVNARVEGGEPVADALVNSGQLRGDGNRGGFDTAAVG